MTAKAAPLGYARALGLVAAATGLAVLLVMLTPLESVSAIYMLPGLAAAVWYGTGPAIAAALLGAVMTSLFYPPLFSVVVVRPSQIVDLVISLIVALTIGRLAGRLRAEMLRVRADERRVRQLYSLSSEIAGAGDVAAIYDIVAAHMAETLGREVVLFAAGPGQAWRAIRPVAGAAPAELTEETRIFAAGGGRSGLADVALVDLSSCGRWLFCRLGRSGPLQAVLAVAMGGGTDDPSGAIIVSARSILEEGARSLERLGLTRALEERQLRQRTDALRDILMESVSHELRTPVAGILGSASVLAAAPPVACEPRLLELSQAIAGEAGRLDRRIQNLLDITRIRAGALQPRVDEIDPADIVNGALDSAADRLKGRKVELKLDGDLPFVRVDPVLVEQALINILENAAKFAPAGAPVTISARREAGTLAIEVHDEGPGLDPQEADQVFERFFRGERHADIAGGSGLGLTIAKTFVEANGGRIEPRSAGRGRGTTMCIWLPLAPELRAKERDDD
jgi:two-component system sensor histidine kinase KdpD